MLIKKRSFKYFSMPVGMRNIFLFTVCKLVLGGHSYIATASISSRFQTLNCPRASEFQSNSSHYWAASLMECILICNRQELCQSVMYHRTPQHTCQLFQDAINKKVSEMSFASRKNMLLKSYDDCIWFRKIRETNTDVDVFKDDESICEFESRWSNINDWDDSNFEKMSTPESQTVPMKMVQIYDDDVVGIIDIVSFDVIQGNGFQVITYPRKQINNKDRFNRRHIMLFQSYKNKEKITEIGTLLEGTEFEIKNLSISADILAENSSTCHRFAYNETFNSVSKIFGFLSKGYRLLSRLPVRVEFDSQSSEVNTETLMSRLTDEKETLHDPLNYTCVKESLSGLKHVTKHGAMTGIEYGRSYTTENFRHWEFDISWEEIKSGSDSELFLKLTELLLAGNEIRVVLGETVSSDVIQAVVAPNDVVVQLADYMTPFKPSDANLVPWNDLGLVFSAVSTSKKLVGCETIYQKPKIKRKLNQPSPEIRWFGRRAKWVNVFTYLQETGPQGDLEVLSYFIKKGLNIRICFKQIDLHITHCVSAPYHTISIEQHIVAQTEMLMKFEFIDGLLSDIESQSCFRTAYLISTTGEIISKPYLIGSTKATYSKLSLSDIYWYVQNSNNNNQSLLSSNNDNDAFDYNE